MLITRSASLCQQRHGNSNNEATAAISTFPSSLALIYGTDLNHSFRLMKPVRLHFIYLSLLFSRIPGSIAEDQQQEKSTRSSVCGRQDGKTGTYCRSSLSEPLKKMKLLTCSFTLTPSTVRTLFWREKI